MKQNQDITEKLNSLRFIEPDAAFARTSKTLIFNSEPAVKTWSFPVWRLASSAVLATILLTFIFYQAVRPEPVLSSSFNPQSLAQEFKNLTINVQIQEISYRQEMNQTVSSALNEVKSTNASHLNQSILQSENSVLELQDSINPEIDKLLEKVIL